jgi:hypothetical protein
VGCNAELCAYEIKVRKEYDTANDAAYFERAYGFVALPHIPNGNPVRFSQFPDDRTSGATASPGRLGAPCRARGVSHLALHLRKDGPRCHVHSAAQDNVHEGLSRLVHFLSLGRCAVL